MKRSVCVTQLRNSHRAQGCTQSSPDQDVPLTPKWGIQLIAAGTGCNRTKLGSSKCSNSGLSHGLGAQFCWHGRCPQVLLMQGRLGA